MFWSSKDPSHAATISTVAALSGVAPTAGMWNDFNAMQDAGWLDGARSNGDVQARWLSWLLLKNGRLQAGAGPRAALPELAGERARTEA